MAESVIHKPQFVIRELDIKFTVSANDQYNTNLYTLINNDMPSGYRFIAIAGFTTNSQYIVPVSVRYVNTAYSFQVKRVTTGSETTTANVYYLAVKE